MARVSLTPSAQWELDRAPSTIRIRLNAILRRLEGWPSVSGARPLRWQMVGRWRMRTGDWRVQFIVLGEEVVVERIGNRDRFYER